ncbi:MAG: hypothetical protein ABSD73_09145 [Candidatus Bathyarchaeia archaeon]|jgi:hypothetical protein
MTIKITQVATASGQIMLTVTYDNPKGSGTLYIFQPSYQSLVERLVQVSALLGRNVTLTDAQQALVEIVNEVRKNQAGIPQNFDFTPYIGTELET